MCIEVYTGIYTGREYISNHIDILIHIGVLGLKHILYISYLFTMNNDRASQQIRPNNYMNSKFIYVPHTIGPCLYVIIYSKITGVLLYILCHGYNYHIV